MDDTPTATALRGPPPRLLLTLEAGSRVFRLTDGPAVVVTRNQASESSLPFVPGLSPVTGVDRLLTWFTGSAQTRTVSVSVLLPVSMAQLMSQGHSMLMGTAELAQHYDGQTWEQRRVLIRGRVVDPVFDGEGHPFAFAISENPGEDQGSLLIETQRVSSETFPRLDAVRPSAYVGANERIDPNINGAYLPVIIGTPGEGAILKVAGLDITERVAAVPVLYVERTDSNVTVGDHVFALAQHEVKATTCYIHNVTDGLTDTAAVVGHGVDGLGQRFAYARPSANNRIPVSESIEVYASFGQTAGGGMPDPFGPGVLRRADHVILWALSRSSIRWDPAMAPRLEALRAFQIDGFINTQAKAWPWLRDKILPLLPVSVGGGPDGVSIVPWRPDATASEAVAGLEVGRNCRRVAPVSYATDQPVANRFAIRFGLSARTGIYGQWRARTGARTTAEEGSSYVTSDLWCSRSQSVFGVVDADPVETEYISDGATADLILAWMARARTFPRAVTGLMLDRSLDWLRPGDVVTLADSSLSMSGHVVHIEGLSMQSGRIACAVTWWESLRYSA